MRRQGGISATRRTGSRDVEPSTLSSRPFGIETAYTPHLLRPIRPSPLHLIRLYHCAGAGNPAHFISDHGRHHHHCEGCLKVGQEAQFQGAAFILGTILVFRSQSSIGAARQLDMASAILDLLGRTLPPRLSHLQERWPTTHPSPQAQLAPLTPATHTPTASFLTAAIEIRCLERLEQASTLEASHRQEGALARIPAPTNTASSRTAATRCRQGSASCRARGF